jgi:AAA domain
LFRRFCLTEKKLDIIMSAEDGLADTIRPRLEDMGADIGRVVALRGLMDDEGQERPLNLADLDVIEKAILEHHPALVIVDPIIAYVAGKDTHKANEVRGLLAPLAALAEKFKIAILAIRHLNKGTGKAAYRGQGSVDFLAACRSAFLAGEDPENPGQKVLCHIKANLGPKTPSITYTINDGRFLWGEETSITAEQVLAVPIEGDERSKVEEAKSFLEDTLGNGPLASSEGEKETKGAGIAPTTLRRAKTALGVKPKKASFGGGWIWSLPDRRCSSNPEDAHTKRMSAFGQNEHLGAKEEGWEDVP